MGFQIFTGFWIIGQIDQSSIFVPRVDQPMNGLFRSTTIFDVLLLDQRNHTLRFYKIAISGDEYIIPPGCNPDSYFDTTLFDGRET